jgi:mono/diheme cytochrome c family protein
MTAATLRLMTAAFAVIAAYWIGTALAQEEKTPAGDVGRGKQIFVADGCFECHGYVGQGARAMGPRVGPMALPFEAFLAQLRSPFNEMPPYTEPVLSDQDAANIFAYLKAIPAPKAAKDIPLLNR